MCGVSEYVILNSDDMFQSLETLDNGKPFKYSFLADLELSIKAYRWVNSGLSYFAFFLPYMIDLLDLWVSTSGVMKSSTAQRQDLVTVPLSSRLDLSYHSNM